MNFLLVMILSISCVSGEVEMNLTTEYELPLVVLEGQNFEIVFEANFALDMTPIKNRFNLPSSNTDLYLTPGDTTWFSFDSFSPVDDTRPEAWQIQWWQGNIGSVDRAMGIRVRHASKKDNGEWSVTAFSTDGSLPKKFNFNVTIAEIPSAISFVQPNFQGESVTFKKTGDEDISDEAVTCKVSHVRPAPTFQWMIGSNLVYLDDSEDNTFNASIGKIEEVKNTEDDEYLDVTQTLTLRPQSWMDGQYLRCRTNHTAYNSTHVEEDKSVSINIIVQAPPVPNNTVIETEADGELVSGQPGVILIPFHSNPPPNNITWYLTDLGQPLTGNQTLGKYTSEGWMEYNKTTTRAKTTTASRFVARLRIDKLRSSDSGVEHSLTVVNEIGQSNYTFRIQEITKVGLGGGEIAGIVIGCLVAAVLIVFGVIMVIRRRNIKKSKKDKEERRREREEGGKR